MRIPVEGPTCIYGDNQSVPANTTITDSSLKKMSQSIAYHFVHEGAARDEWGTSHVNTHENEADLLTMQLPSGEKRKGFVSNLLHHIFGLSGSVMKKRGVNYVQVEPQVWCRGVDGYANIEPQHTHIDI